MDEAYDCTRHRKGLLALYRLISLLQEDSAPVFLTINAKQLLSTSCTQVPAF